MVHLSTELPTGLHLVEVRRQQLDGSTAPDFGDHAGEQLALAGGGTVRVLGRMPGSVRLWVATLDLPAPLLDHLCRFGRPIRYGYVPDSWPHRRPTELVRPPSPARPRCRRRDGR